MSLFPILLKNQEKNLRINYDLPLSNFSLSWSLISKALLDISLFEFSSIKLSESKSPSVSGAESKVYEKKGIHKNRCWYKLSLIFLLGTLKI